MCVGNVESWPPEDLELSALRPLLAGDVTFAGAPADVGMARQPPRARRSGQVLESWIEGIGRIRNRWVAT
jgi:2,4-didehydro-3-deoxy-L-rhamnonate hydrolase